MTVDMDKDKKEQLLRKLDECALLTDQYMEETGGNRYPYEDIIQSLENIKKLVKEGD